MKLPHFLLLVGICTIWGFNFVAAKVGVNELPPLLFTGLRFLLLAAVLIPFLKPATGRMRDVLSIAFFNGPLHFGLMFTGVSLAAASVVAVVAQLMVPFATILSIVMLGEVIHWRRWAGIAMTVGGVTIVSFDPHVFDSISGVAFAAGGAFAAAVATVLMRRLTGVGVFQLQSWTAIVAAPALLLGSALFESGQLAAIGNTDAIGWSALLFTAIGASLIGHNVYFWLLQRYEVSLVAPISLLSPILGVVFGVLILEEPLTARLIVGATIAFAGVAVLALRGRTRVETAA